MTILQSTNLLSNVLCPRGHMKNVILIAVLALLGVSLAHAQTDVLIEIDRGRSEGVFSKTPVFQRAILSKPVKPADTALLFFRGSPGYARIQSLGDKMRNLHFLRMHQKLFSEEGIALVVMDCPTDQWGQAQDQFPTNCFDNYRSSKEHADDVRSVMAKLRDEHGFSRFYLMGHSSGTISSRWLAKNLGNEIAGSIHSASINVPHPKGTGSSMVGFRYDTVSTPMLHVHNENDACRGTPYSIVKGYARDNLVTVRGGIPEGNPCGGGHLHSHQGREEPVVKAVISWIKTGKVEPVIGE